MLFQVGYPALGPLHSQAPLWSASIYTLHKCTRTCAIIIVPLPEAPLIPSFKKRSGGEMHQSLDSSDILHKPLRCHLDLGPTAAPGRYYCPGASCFYAGRRFSFLFSLSKGTNLYFQLLHRRAQSKSHVDKRTHNKPHLHLTSPFR